MPLHILLILVAGGIAGIALVLHLLGLTNPRVLDLTDLRTEWLRHYPDDTFNAETSIDVMLNISGTHGLLRSDQGYGLIWTMGADTVGRRLDTATWRETPSGITFTFDDPATPRVVVQLEDSERVLWLAYLRKFHGS